MPTLEQRYRVFEVLGTLTGYHTRQVRNKGFAMERLCSGSIAFAVYHQLATSIQAPGV